ncbi:MAG: transaldolase, partial [Planctomycetes bacterium]|nr:transaldolase [Planctomycetota bacterium]
VDAADLLRPVYDRTDRVDGYVSLEVNPKLAGDTSGTIAEAKRLHAALNRPNVLIKVPATEEGIPAIEALIAEGISINITLIFSLKMYEKVMRAYLDGLTRLAENGEDLSKVASVASFFVSRVDSLIDSRLENRPTSGETDHLLGRAAIANAKLAYARFEEVFAESGAFGKLAENGARVQRPLWASTSTKNPAYPPTMYVDGLMAPRTVNTLSPGTIDSMTGNTLPACTIRDDLAGCRALFDELKSQGIDIDEVTSTLLKDGVALFARSFDELLANLEQKRKQVRAAG